ncbi:MAG: D-aminoacyl-tRNA deacylase, partial [Nanoarchaeota archaeon]
MKPVIVTSKRDKAGMNIASFISELPVYYVEEEIIYAENLHEKPEIGERDFVIFASKHKSEQERKTFSIHAPGNWGKAELGGREGKVCMTSALFLKHLFKTLVKKAENSGYECTLECTHHGPYLEKPCCFIEIGSGEEQWRDEKAGKIIAETIKKAISTFNSNQKFIPAIGIGGPHYCPNFNKIQLNSDIAISHIIPQYAFPITEG